MKQTIYLLFFLACCTIAFTQKTSSSILSKMKLANAYYNGRGVPRDNKKSFILYKECADSGYAYAMHITANMCIRGIGTDTNYLKGIEWYNKAVDNGYVYSLKVLGEIYAYGRYAPKDTLKALQYFNQATDKSCTMVWCDMAWMYLHGYGFSKNYAKALEYYNTAVSKGYNNAWNGLGYMYEYGFGVDKDFNKAYEYYYNACKAGNTTGFYNHGYCYYKGIGCVQNYDSALLYLRKAAINNHTGGMYYLGLSYKNGYGLSVNKDSADYWLRKSSMKGNRTASVELGLNEPENSDLTGSMTDIKRDVEEMTKHTMNLNQYRRVSNSIYSNEIEGDYTGYLLKYDFSGQHILKINKLDVHLKYDNNLVKGEWIEDDTLSIPVKATATPRALMFEDMYYERNDRNKKHVSKSYGFDNAQLSLIQENNQIYLAGDLKLSEIFTREKKETANPFYVVLMRTNTSPAKGNGTLISQNNDALLNNKLNVFPNPFTNNLNLDFELTESCKVNTQIISLDGKVVYSNPSGILTAGTYTLPIAVSQIMKGTYMLKFEYGNKVKTTKVIKL